jgi:hypothetical protein
MRSKNRHNSIFTHIPIFRLAGIVCMASWLFFTACQKDSITTDPGDQLGFSADTLKFDTIFTTLGSTTKFFTIRNTHKNAIRISEIKLAGGPASSYRINVDGDPGTSFTDIVIPAEDSLYVFVEVTIDPNSADLPFVLYDSIQFQVNGNVQQVLLQAYGQNAHFFDADSIETNVTWIDDLPYVILNYLQVKPAGSLTINPRCQVYFGGGAAMIVEGELTIGNTSTLDSADAVLFRGIRLDEDVSGTDYDKYPGQWAGIFFLRESKGDITNLILRNSLYGINVGNIKTTDNEAENLLALQSASINNAAELSIRNSRIYNNAFYGIFGFLGKIYAENVLAYGAGSNVVGLYYGGEYKFVNCTFQAGGNAFISHTKDPVLYFSNYFKYSATAPALEADSAIAQFYNCILYGTLDEEVLTDELASNPHTLNFLFDHNCIKTEKTFPAGYISCISADPQFESISRSDYRLKTGSPCIDAGNAAETTPNDLNGVPRTDPPEIGVFEFN